MDGCEILVETPIGCLHMFPIYQLVLNFFAAIPRSSHDLAPTFRAGDICRWWASPHSARRRSSKFLHGLGLGAPGAAPEIPKCLRENPWKNTSKAPGNHQEIPISCCLDLNWIWNCFKIMQENENYLNYWGYSNNNSTKFGRECTSAISGRNTPRRSWSTNWCNTTVWPYWSRTSSPWLNNSRGPSCSGFCRTLWKKLWHCGCSDWKGYSHCWINKRRVLSMIAVVASVISPNLPEITWSWPK